MKKALIALAKDNNFDYFSEKAISICLEEEWEIALVMITDNRFVINDENYTIQDYTADSHKESLQTLHQLEKKYHFHELEFFIADGSPEKKILETSKKWSADFLIIGTHAHKGLVHFMEGSLAELIIRHSEVPVLVIPPPKNH